MRLHFCGVRGSTPAPGPAFVRYGGNTSCVAIAHDGATAPSLVLDAGTGLSRLTDVLDGEPFRGTMLLGHLHWDHTHGLPFFPAGDRPGSKVSVHLPAQGSDPVDVLARCMSPPHFLIGPRELRGEWTFHRSRPRPVRDGGLLRVGARDPPQGRAYRRLPHRRRRGERRLPLRPQPCRARAGDRRVRRIHDAALALADGVDVLIHDAQHTAAEFAGVKGCGHSAVEYAVGLAERAGSRRLMLFHHDPRRRDDEIDAIVAGFGGGAVPVEAAAEGRVLSLP